MHCKNALGLRSNLPSRLGFTVKNHLATCGGGGGGGGGGGDGYDDGNGGDCDDEDANFGEDDSKCCIAILNAIVMAMVMGKTVQLRLHAR